MICFHWSCGEGNILHKRKGHLCLSRPHPAHISSVGGKDRKSKSTCFLLVTQGGGTVPVCTSIPQSALVALRFQCWCAAGTHKSPFWRRTEELNNKDSFLWFLWSYSSMTSSSGHLSTSVFLINKMRGTALLSPTPVKGTSFRAWPTWRCLMASSHYRMLQRQSTSQIQSDPMGQMPGEFTSLSRDWLQGTGLEPQLQECPKADQP